MKRIMFVCLGNICRSPLAEAVFHHVVDQNGALERYEADSSGTIGYHAGEPADPRMRQVALSHGVRISHRSKPLKRRHLSEFDLILCMDRENLEDARMLARLDADAAKIRLFRDFDPEGTGAVPDPYYGGDAGFERVFAIVERTAAALFRHLEESP